MDRIPERYNKNEVTNDFKKREIKIKVQFLLQENQNNNYTKRSTWKPDKSHHTVNFHKSN